jgi:hypothetical protein
VSFTQSTGSAPALVQVVLDASQLAVGLHQANVTISSGATALFSIPVKLRVEPVNLTIVKSDPASPLVYAISEDTSTTPARAYLLEINTVTETIRQVVPVGASVTDLALHKGDNRIYVPNWATGSLLAIDLTTFQQVRAYAFAPFGGVGYSQGDIYRVSAGVAGRIVWEEQDQWIDINIFDTVNGTNLAKAFVREGGGGFDATGRYYYHGDNNSSGAEIHKFDVTGDRFTSLASVRVANASYYGSRTVTVSDNGNRIFWNGAVFDPNLAVEWAIGEHIYACSADGRYAFGEGKVFDVDQRNVLMTTPATTAKAFNSITGKLVYKGSNGIAYLKLDPREEVVPADGSIVTSVDRLIWEALPFDAVYHVYLGQSPTNIPFINGTFGGTNLAISPLAAGTYFWQVVGISEYGNVTSRVHRFTVSSISPSIRQITAATFQNRHVTTSITLTSQAPGEVWQALADASWISFSQSNGVTPATIQVTLDASAAPPVVRNGSIHIHGSGGGRLFSIPVELTVEGLYLTILKSDPASHKVYAISEDTSANPRRAYLLEINTQTESIERVISVGSSVTDLAIHNRENRLYVPNWLTGALLAIDKNTFLQVRSYNFAPFGGTGYGDGDVYRVSAGAAGRIVWEEEDQWIEINIFDTVNGTNIASAGVREGGGGFDPTGRFYYHGENNSSGAVIHKFDVTGDRFTSVTSIRVAYAGYYGSRAVTVSESGNRVFWNGAVFDANLVEEWAVGEHIYSCSPDGRYAFSASKIYDVNQKQAILNMPVTTSISAFNSSTRKLVVQSGNTIGFYPLADPLSLPAPVLSAGFVWHDWIQLSWTDRSLEENFTLQRRLAGSATWEDVATIPANTNRYTVTGLLPSRTYEFRIKANAGSISSDWSAVVTARTSALPPSPPVLNPPVVTMTSVTLSWSHPSGATQFFLERSVGTQSNWVSLPLPANVPSTSYIDTDVSPQMTYHYRVKADDSAFSNTRTVTIPAPTPPAAPSGLAANSLSNATVLITWSDVLAETGYRLERRNEDPTSWAVISLLASNVTSYVDTNVIEGVQYWYRVQAFNGNGNSQYSNQDDVIPAHIVVLIADDFDPDIDPSVWANISGGVATNGGQGFRGSKALYFGGAASRSAATVPVDVSSGSVIEFRIRAGNEAVDGNAFWNNSEGGEGVVLEYSRDGANWSPFNLNLNTVYPSASNWVSFSVPIPSIAFSPTTQFRWRQPMHSGPASDCWALEDVAIRGSAPLRPEAPPFVISSASSSTSIAILWIAVNRAANYVVERRLSSEAWSAIATVPGTVTYFTDTSVTPSSAYSYRVKAVNAAGDSPYSPVTTSFTWSQIQQWANDNFGNPDAMNGLMTTPNDDGTLPLLRYAFNLNSDEPAKYVAPGQSSGFPAIWLDSTRNRLCIEFVRRKAAMNPGITYRAQFCHDLWSWQDAPAVLTTTPIDSIWERVRYEDAIQANQAPARFGRVIVSVE